MTSTPISTHVQESVTPEVFTEFVERSGINMSNGLTVEQADREAYHMMFGCDFETNQRT